MNGAVEAAAVALGLLYLVLAIREARSCWLAGGLASLLFLWIFQDSGLPMQALLQVYYVAVAVHGWLHWGRREDAASPRPHRVPWTLHGLGIAAWLLAATVSVVLRDATSDAQAWLDSVSSWGGVLATWLVARKVLSCWLYWILIDALSMLLYLRTGLHATAALYALYTVLAYLGWREWLAHYRRETASPANA